MSNFLAIATVTETLKQALTPPAAQAVSGADVKTVRPTTLGTGLPSKGINLFLYQVTSNGSLSNADLPTRDGSGHLLVRPQAALNLHYLLSFYGDDDNLEPQRLLGVAVRTLHARPVLSRAVIRATIDRVVASDPQHFLKNADLADQVELVKFTPLQLTLEELSKVWSIFFQTNYALSVAYQGSVVLIESDSKPAPSLPVARRTIHAAPLHQPIIEMVSPQLVAPGATVTISGQNLRDPAVQVVFGAIAVTPTTVSDSTIDVDLPVGLRAGVNTVRVRHFLDFGTPTEPHGGAESNAAAFMLQPTITAVAQNPSTVTEAGIQMKKGEVQITFDPKVGRSQHVVMLLNQLTPPPGSLPQAFSFQAPPGNGLANPGDTETNTVVIAYKIRKEHEGDYLVRAGVDGAQSDLEMDTATGKYNGPLVAL
jgi:hypothetical protein